MITKQSEADSALRRLERLEGMIHHSTEFDDIEMFHQIMTDTLEDLHEFAFSKIPRLVIDNTKSLGENNE